MRVILNLSLLTLLFISVVSKADVEITAEEGVSILAVNGKQTSPESFFASSDNEKLDNGLNQLLIQYTAEIGRSDDFTLEKSKLFIITFDQSDEALLIKEPRKIVSEHQLDKFNKSRNWVILNKSNKEIDYKIDVLEKDGFQFTRDYEEELQEYNQSNSPAALISVIAEKNSQKPYSKAGITSSTSESTKKNMAADMLRFWYDQADAETRADFLRWITTK